ncbi:hypothetical protein Acr_00g0084210 [Actinidia rufa]|uniref:Probable zinc-ribbon domain-containing protein n=1 Tax=Actinidia rufa TaxID=165716 RepID=A0A7J0DWA6_9ERIC|nr:hypothetical protein Acr_00g0084210 [Actinidia rufa]
MNPDEGPSTYQRGSFQGYAVQKRKGLTHVFDGSSGVENSEHDRAELIRKLDELKDLLSRDCDVREKPREWLPVDRKTILLSASDPPQFCILHGLDMGEFYPPRKARNEFVGSNLPPTCTRAPHRPPPRYLTNPYNHDPLKSHRSPLASYQYESFSPHPTPHPLVCCATTRNRQIPPKSNLAYPVLRHLESSNSSSTNHLLYSPTQRPQTKSPTGFDLETGDHAHGHLRREVVVHRSERVCLPIAGGAPFLTCCSCFELLRLPRKLVATEKNQQNLRDTETSVLSSDRRLNVGESHERQEPLSSTFSFSENEQNPDSGIFQKEISKSSDLPPKEDLPLPFSDSLDCKDPAKASSDKVVSRYGVGNKSKCNDQEKAVLERSVSVENSVTDVLVATEMEVPSSEFQNSIMSQDWVEVSKVEDQTTISKESEFFYANLLKRTFGNFSRSSQKIGRPNVFVNGQPMSDLVVQKAEMIAGHIQPGNYWYDYQAGFWGVMGHPCLGIIPPFIEEINYPMPENCAAGNTGVLVNGRELNQKDLDLLASRGLPTTRDKSYVVTISG